MRIVAQTILLLSTGYLPVAFAFLKLQAITGDGVENGCSQEQLSHLMESVRQASEAAHNTGSTLLSARDHSFAAVEILLGGQHYKEPSTKETFAAAVTNHIVNVALVLSQNLGTASEFSPHKDTLNFACPLEQEQPIVVGSGPSGIKNVLEIGPSFFTMSSKSTADKDAYDAAKKTSRNSRIFAQMPPFTSAAFHILRASQAMLLGVPVRGTPLSLGSLADSALEPDGCASVCILHQLDKEPFVPCNPVGAEITRTELPSCPSMSRGTLEVRRSRVRRMYGQLSLQQVVNAQRAQDAREAAREARERAPSTSPVYGVGEYGGPVHDSPGGSRSPSPVPPPQPPSARSRFRIPSLLKSSKTKTPSQGDPGSSTQGSRLRQTMQQAVSRLSLKSTKSQGPGSSSGKSRGRRIASMFNLRKKKGEERAASPPPPLPPMPNRVRRPTPPPIPPPPQRAPPHQEEPLFDVGPVHEYVGTDLAAYLRRGTRSRTEPPGFRPPGHSVMDLNPPYPHWI